MPNRYQREIEEILRNMERTEPRPTLRDRLNTFNQRQPRRPGRTTRPVARARVSAPAPLFAGSVLCAVVGSGLAYYDQRAGLVSGALAVAAFALALMALFTVWNARFRGYPTPTWRGQSTTQTNVTPFPTRRRNPLNTLLTQWRILALKLRYRRSRRDDG